MTTIFLRWLVLCMATFYVDAAVGNDSNAGTAPGAGNAWATLAHALTTMGGADTVYAKASAIYHESGALIMPPAASAEAFPRLIGYATTPADGGQITVQAANPSTQFVFAHQFAFVRNVIFDFNGQNVAQGFVSTNTNSDATLMDCAAINVTAGNTGIRINRDSVIRCVAKTSVSNAGSIGLLGNDHGEFVDCVADGPFGDGFHLAGDHNSCDRCIARNCQTGFFAADLAALEGCVAYNCTVAGAQATGASLPFFNCAFVKCAYGVTVTGGTLADSAEDYCAYGLNTTADVLNFSKGAHDVALTGDPFVNPTAAINTYSDAAAAFALNSTSGAGAACRAAGYPANLDIGATQHAETTSPPATPTITAVVSGQQVTFSVAGSTGGSTNTIDAVSVAANGALTWTNLGSRTGDGNVIVNPHPAGQYLTIVSSVLGGLPAAPSAPYEYFVPPVAGARSVTPTSPLAKAVDGVMWLIASSATFQTATGLLSAAAAIEKVVVETDDTEESGSTRPRAIVNPVPNGYTASKIAGQEFQRAYVFDVSFESVPSAPVEAESTREDRLVDEAQEFFNLVSGIISDCEANQGIGTGHLAGTTQIAVSKMELIGWGPQEDVRAAGQRGETPAYFYAAVFQFTVTGY